jgi:hypothetical protein
MTLPISLFNRWWVETRKAEGSLADPEGVGVLIGALSIPEKRCGSYKKGSSMLSVAGGGKKEE